MPEEPPVNDSLSMLVTDDSFVAILGGFMRRCISWEEFLEQPLPRGISPKTMWDILNRLSYAIGVRSPVPDYDGNLYSYRRTYEIDDAITNIAASCATGSPLHGKLMAAEGQPFITRTRIEEAAAAARLDGLSITTNDVIFLLSHEKTPKTPIERLLVNMFNANDRLEEFAKETFSIEMFKYLQELLLDGVDVGGIKRAKPPLGLTLFDWPEGVAEAHFSAQMAIVRDWANDETSDPHEHCILRPLVIVDCFRFYRPMGIVSQQVGSLVADIYAIKHGYPVQALLPVSKAELDWCEGRIKPPDVSFDKKAFDDLRWKSPYDLTCMMTIVAQLTEIALKRTVKKVDEWEQKDARLRELLQSEPDLNQRQRHILGKALRNPDSEFYISFHKRNYNLSYPTARNDLMDLVDRGFLTCEQRGKAFVFLPAQELYERFGKS